MVISLFEYGGEEDMDKKKISTTVYITPEQNHLLKALNDKTKVPIAEYIRQGIDLILERNRNLLPGQMLLLGEDGSKKLKSETT
jgi:Ribbon-helix-helix domain